MRYIIAMEWKRVFAFVFCLAHSIAMSYQLLNVRLQNDMVRILKITVVGLVLGTIALFLALASSWGSYATSDAGRILSIVFGWPFS